jgi:ATP-dependent Clp protease protease subunit
MKSNSIAPIYDLHARILETAADHLHRRIYVYGMIDDAVAYRFNVALSQMDQIKGSIDVHICTFGGEVESGLAMFDAIRLARNPVRIIGTGPVMSMGVTLLQAGTERFLTENARVLLHDGFGDQEGSLLKLKSLGKEAGETVARMAAIVSARSGMDIDDVVKLMNAETFLSATEAMNLNLADGIVLPHTAKKRSAK